MLFVIIGVYILFGGISVFTNLGSWLFNSLVWAIPLLPFMIAYWLIKGDEKKRAQAIIVLKGMMLLVAIYVVFVIAFKAII